MRIKLVDQELTEPIEAITDLKGYEEVWILVKLHGLALGNVKLQVLTSTLEPGIIIDQIVAYLGWPIMAHLLEDALLAQSGFGSTPFDLSAEQVESKQPDPSQLRTLLLGLRTDRENEPPCIQWRRSRANWSVTVGVCTRNGAQRLDKCLEALKALDYPDYEILIVDNASSDNSVYEVVARHSANNERVRYVAEPRQGVSWARNRVVLEARGDIVAMTDDDARPDQFWLLNLVAALQRPGVSMVTGICYPRELENEVQVYCEKNWGHNGGFDRKEYAIRPGGLSKHTYQTNSFGGSGNLATWRGTFSNIGGFDPALGRGSLSGSASDTDLFYRLLQDGYILYYDPTALVRMVHPSDFEQVKRHDYLGTSGLFAFITKCFINEPQNRGAILKYGIKNLFVWYIWKYLKALFASEKQLRSIRFTLLKGALVGPRNYLRAVKKAKEVAAEYGKLEIPQQAGK